MGLRDFFIKGKDYAQEAAYYLEEQGKKAKKVITATPTYTAKLNKKFVKTAKFVKKFDENLYKELTPARRFAESTQTEMLYQVGMRKLITVTSQRKDGTCVINQFPSAQEAVTFIKTAKRLGHTIIKIQRR